MFGKQIQLANLDFWKLMINFAEHIISDEVDTLLLSRQREFCLEPVSSHIEINGCIVFVEADKNGYYR